MRIKQLFKDDDAVSPVIGVILMVAITVILAAVIGTFVLGLGNKVSQTSPQATFSMDFGQQDVTITHDGGDTIPSGDDVNVTSTATLTSPSGSIKSGASGFYFDGAVSAGTSGTIEKSGSNWDGEAVRVTWTSANGDSSSTLAKQTAPKA